MLRARRFMGSAKPLAAAHALSKGHSGRKIPAVALQYCSQPISASTRLSIPHSSFSTSSIPSNGSKDAATKQLENDLDACRDSGDWHKALKLLDESDSQQIALNATMYESAIVACARQGRLDLIPGLLHNMSVDGIAPTTTSVDFVIQACIARQDWRGVQSHIMDFVDRKVLLSDAAFRAGLEALGKSKNPHATKRFVYYATRDNGLASPIDNSHVSAMVRCLGRCNQSHEAVKLVARLRRQKVLEMDPEIYDQLVRTQVLNKRLPEALHTIAEAHQKQFALSEPVYTTTIAALVKDGKQWSARTLFDEMIAHEVQPSSYCYGRMIVSSCRVGKHAEAWDFWKIMQELQQHEELKVKKYAAILSDINYTKDNKVTLSIFEFLLERVEPNYIPDSAFAAAIRAHGRLQNTEKAIELFDLLVASRQKTRQSLPSFAGFYLSTFNALSRDEKRDPEQNIFDAKRAWDIMNRALPKVLPPAYASLANVFASNGELETLDELVERWDEIYTPPKIKDQDVEEALDEVVEETTHRDSLLYHGMLSGFAKAREDPSEQVWSHLAAMHARGLPIDDRIIKSCAECFIKHENWQMIKKLLQLVDLSVLEEPTETFGVVTTKLLEVKGWESARLWMAKARRNKLHPVYRGKGAALHALNADGSDNYRVAFALAMNTFSFKELSTANALSLCDAMDVLMREEQPVMVLRLFNRLDKAYLQNEANVIEVPLRMYKLVIKALMKRNPVESPVTNENLERAAELCTQMLQKYPTKLDSEAVSLAISIRASVRDDDDVISLFEMMQQHGMEANSYAISAAVTAYTRSGQMDKVIALRDDLLNKKDELEAASVSGVDVEEDVDGILQDAVEPSLLDAMEQRGLPAALRTVLNSFALTRMDEEITKTVTMFPTTKTSDVVSAYVHAKRLERAVAHYDETCHPGQFSSVLRKMSVPNKKHYDPILSAAFLLKFARLHGLQKLRSKESVSKVSRLLLRDGHLDEAYEVLQMYESEEGQELLRELAPEVQKDTMEMMLYAYGEEGDFERLGALLTRQLQPFAIDVRHFETAMEYCVQRRNLEHTTGGKASRKEQKGAAKGLQLFEALRQQFIQPTGGVYLLALQSCLRLDLLDSTGKLILADAKDQRMMKQIALELMKVTTKAKHEREARARRGIGRLTKKQRQALEESLAKDSIDVYELAKVALYLHHNGIEMSGKVASTFASFEKELSKDMVNELRYLAKFQAKNDSKAAPGQRWGQVYLDELE